MRGRYLIKREKEKNEVKKERSYGWQEARLSLV
jgi:hypothetical protein